jgi:hypothetical protein
MAKYDYSKMQKALDDLVLQQKSLNETYRNIGGSLQNLDDLNDINQELSRLSSTMRTAQNPRGNSQDSKQYNQLKKIADNLEKQNSFRSKGGRKLTVNSAAEIENKRFNEEYSANKSKFQNAKNSSNPKQAMGAMIGDALGDIVNSVGNIIQAQMQKNQEIWMAEQDIYEKTLETGGKIFQRHMKAFGKGMNGVVTSTFDSITKGVNEGAFASAKNSVDYGTEMLSNMIDDNLDRLKLGFYETRRNAERDVKVQQLTMDQVNGATSSAFGLVNTFLGPIGNAVTGLVQGIIQTGTKLMQAQTEIEFQKLSKQLDIQEKQYEQIVEAKKQGLEQAKQAADNVMEFAHSIEQLTLVNENYAKEMGNVLGVGSKYIDQYTKNIFSSAQNLKVTKNGKTKYLDKSVEDMQKVQNGYIDESGRNIAMSEGEFTKSLGLGEVLGDDNLASTLLGGLDYFNMSIENGTDLIFSMYQEANRAGVSNRKFAKDLQQNLKLAQKYTFKDGVKGMMKMAIWAQKTRFNMNALDGMLSKISEGGLEGVITQAAQLQVTGGAAAMGADPLAMMFERYNDPAAFARRSSSMFDDLGMFNSKTGEVEIKGADAMLLEARAKALGMSTEDARNMVTQKIKGSQIDKRLTANYTDEQKGMLYNKAQYDQKTKQWNVNVMRKDENGQMKMTKVGINDLTSDDFEQLMPHEEKIETYLFEMLSIMKEDKGATNHNQVKIEGKTVDDLKAETEKRIADNLDWVDKNIGTLTDEIKTIYSFETESNKQAQDTLIKTSSILQKELNLMLSNAKTFAKNLADTSSQFNNVLTSATLEAKIAELKIKKSNAKSDKEKAEIQKQIDEAEKARDASDSKIFQQVLGEASGDTTQLAPIHKEQAQKAWESYYNRHSDEAESQTKAFIEAYEKYKKADGSYDYEAMKQSGSAVKEVISSDWFGDIERKMKDAKLISNYDNISAEAFKAMYEFAKNASKNKVYQNAVKATNENAKNPYNYTNYVATSDGILSNNNSSMITAADNITSIHDGSVRLAKSDPKDSAIFAKTGGPFDKLFNDVFGKVDAMYEMFNNSNISPRQMSYMSDIASSHRGDKIGNYMNDLRNRNNSGNNLKVDLGTLKVEMSGKLELTSGGQSVDILKQIKQNPTLLRTLTQMISEEVSRNINGGKTKYSGGQIVGGIRNV